MSKKDYIVIAEIITANYYNSNQSTMEALDLAEFFAEELAKNNCKFDTSTFIEYVKRGI